MAAKKTVAPSRPTAPSRPVVKAPKAAPPRVASAPNVDAARAVAAATGRSVVVAPHRPNAPRPIATPSEASRRGPGRPPKMPSANGSHVGTAVALDTRTQALVSEMSAKIGALEATIKAQTETIAKLRAKRANVRTMSEIVEGIEPAKKDWRAEYHGFVLSEAFRFDVDGKGGIELYPDEPPTANVLLAMPRDTDIGGRGAEARAAGLIAIHWNRAEDGESYLGSPAYLTQEQLASVWAAE